MYALAGAAAELERTVPRAGDEAVLLHGAMRLRGAGLLPRPVVLRLTPGRLVVLAHYAFRPDQAWDLPRGCVREVDVVRGVVRITWASEHGESVLELSGWTGREAFDRPLGEAGGVATVLRDWLTSGDGNIAPRQPGGHRPR
jgi:hypothetical protein